MKVITSLFISFIGTASIFFLSQIDKEAGIMAFNFLILYMIIRFSLN